MVCKECLLIFYENNLITNSIEGISVGRKEFSGWQGQFLSKVLTLTGNYLLAISQVIPCHHIQVIFRLIIIILVHGKYYPYLWSFLY